MYTTKNNLVFGFHGCDESIRNSLLLGKSDMKMSENPYDWLGRGMYFLGE